MLILILYVIGCVVSYFIGRKYFGFPENWTIGDRTFVMLRSLFSWITAFAFIYLLIEGRYNDNRKAKW